MSWGIEFVKVDGIEILAVVHSCFESRMLSTEHDRFRTYLKNNLTVCAYCGAPFSKRVKEQIKTFRRVREKLR